MPRNVAARTSRRRRRNNRRRGNGSAVRQAWVRSYTLANPARPLRQPIHRFRQVVVGANLNFLSSALSTFNGNASYALQNSATEVSWAMGFALSDVPQSSTFTGLYDQYRITRVVVHLRPQVAMQAQALVSLTAAPAAVTAPVPTGNIYTAEDLDDNVASNVAAIRQFDTCKITQVMQPRVITHTIFPRCQLGTFTALSATTTGNSLAPYGTWLDCGSAGIPHYGFKLAIDQGVASYLQAWEIDCEYYIEMKGVR